MLGRPGYRHPHDRPCDYPGTDLQPWIAAMLSLLLPGLSQGLMGQVGKAAAIFAVCFILVGGFGVVNVLAALDAWLTARRRVTGHRLYEWEFF